MTLPTNPAEEDFRSVLRRFFDGRGTIDEICEHRRFIAWLNEWTGKLDFTDFHGNYGLKDFRQELQMKLREVGSRLQPADDVEGNSMEDGFFRRFSRVARNHYLSTLRFYRADMRDGFRNYQPVEEMHLWAPKTDFEAKADLSRFVQFVYYGDYPDPWKCAVGLWLENYSHSESAKFLADKGVLNAEGKPFTKVTIGNWVNAVLDDFRKSLGLPIPQTSRPAA